jgi:integrase
MPRARRSENKGLPARWRFVFNAYYYQVPPGQEAAWDGKRTFRLGETLPKAYREWADRAEANLNVRNVAELLDRYALEVIPTKAIATQNSNKEELKAIREKFGTAPLIGIKPQHIYQYIDQRKAKSIPKLDKNGKEIKTDHTGKAVGRREIALLSHALTKAVEWGYIDKHPFKGEVRLAGAKPRTRYIEDWEIIECLSLSSKRKRGSVIAIQAYIRLKLLTGLRRGDLLRLRVTDCNADGIRLYTHKTGKPIIYEWSAELRQAVDDAKAARPLNIAPNLFCDKRGQGYANEKTGKVYGWNSMWQRFMKRVLTETKVTERFTEHDLRAKCASDAKTLEHARALLAHADSRMTERVYRRKPERVQPLR